MVGFVIVSHSHQLAQGVKELAEQLSQSKVPIAAAGGLDDTTLGTSLDRVMSAVESVYNNDGVLVMIDLGSAELTTRLAIEMLPDDKQGCVLISSAPLVEGTIAAVVEASNGSSLDQVIQAAQKALSVPKLSAEPIDEEKKALEGMPEDAETSSGNKVILTLTNPLGLHARPATSFVQAASVYESNIRIRNLDRNTSFVNAKSLLEVLSLGIEKDMRVEIKANGGDANQAIESLKSLIESKFE